MSADARGHLRTTWGLGTVMTATYYADDGGKATFNVAGFVTYQGELWTVTMIEEAGYWRFSDREKLRLTLASDDDDIDDHIVALNPFTPKHWPVPVEMTP